MAIDSDIRDQAYQFFIQEAPELLQVIETELLDLKQNRTAGKIHNMMRAAHSIKGGSASVGLDAIKTLSHRLEDIFKALHQEDLVIDEQLETWLLQAYDCLRLPLMEQINTGYFDEEQAIAIAEPLFAQIEEELKDYLGKEDFLPSSVELGIDITLSIFEVDVAQGLERLANVLADPEHNVVAGELRAQAEVFSGIGELFNLSGFTEIAQTAIAALDAHPDQVLHIAEVALADFQAGREAVIAGDRAQGGSPSPALLKLADSEESASLNSTQPITTNNNFTENNFLQDEHFNELTSSVSPDLPAETVEFDWSSLDLVDSSSLEKPELTLDLELLSQQEQINTPSLTDIFAAHEISNEFTELDNGFGLDLFRLTESELTEISADSSQNLTNQIEHLNPGLDEIFGNSRFDSDNSLEFVSQTAETNSTNLVNSKELDKINFINVDDIFDDSATHKINTIIPDIFPSEVKVAVNEPGTEENLQFESTHQVEENDLILSLDEVFGVFDSSKETTETTNGFLIETSIESPAVAEQNNTEFNLANQLNGFNSNTPSLKDVFGQFVEENQRSLILSSLESNPLDTTATTTQETTPQSTNLASNNEENLLNGLTQDLKSSIELPSELVEKVAAASNFQELVQSIEEAYNQLPVATELANSKVSTAKVIDVLSSPISIDSTITQKSPPTEKPESPSANAAQLSVRVDLDRLERMNNVVGELAINRNGLSLQNEQLQGTVEELLRRFSKFQEMTYQLRDLSDKMLVAPDHHSSLTVGLSSAANQSKILSSKSRMETEFDSLEMDNYGELNSRLQETLEEMAQIEEIVGDIALLSSQSSKTLDGQRQMLAYLRDDLMWARMLPLGEVLNRFPRTLRDLSTKYQKPVDLKLSGTGVLVDKAVLEKLYDPLLHLFRNAFDHGIESPQLRRQQNKPERGQIEIRAYHQGSQTVIEMRDDGQGINLQRIAEKAVEVGLIAADEVALTPTSRLLDLLFEPGFSTASKITEISGRGVGLDVVRSQLRFLKGTVTVHSHQGRGTTFILRIPLTLTIAKLLVCMVGSTAYAFPADSIEEIFVPKADQMKLSGKQRLLHWRKRLVPIHHLSELLDYSVPLPETVPSQALLSVPTPEDWASPILLLRQDNQFLALEVDRLITEQELVIKPFGNAIAPPSYIYGCTILGDGSLLPVIDGATLLSQITGQPKDIITTSTSSQTATRQQTPSSAKRQPTSSVKTPLILVVDDSIALRQTLALTLQKAGYRVVQARDGREAIEQLQQNSTIQLVVSDVEMPNMNGFEFLTQRRQDAELSKIPVIMLTSRSSDKHRQLAKHLGASAYFTKPYLEQEFLAGIKDILSKNAPKKATALTT
ncbi:MAG TPA: response regulator [Oculatellaceae cyanobacterium]|jgi:chemotaxis family two-component system sensor histidine kinase/response regulator PixL